jgi:choline dehydrogenase
MRRANLKVITDAQATKVVFDGCRASGVTIRRGDREETFSSRGVVLSAGAFASPQLLMLSGIGPATMLSKFGISVYLNRPQVGENLQDHPTSRVVYGTNSTDTFKVARSLRNLLLYILFKRGMLASNGGEAFAFTQVHSDSVSAPDLEIVFAPGDMRELTQGHGFSFITCVVAPRSRGRLILKSPDPFAPPGIDFGLLSDPHGTDASVLLEGFRLSRKIAATHPLAAYNTGELAPGADIETDRDLLAYANTNLGTIYHPASTCRMGSDEQVVVDPMFLVSILLSLIWRFLCCILLVSLFTLFCAYSQPFR